MLIEKDVTEWTIFMQGDFMSLFVTDCFQPKGCITEKEKNTENATHIIYPPNHQFNMIQRSEYTTKTPLKWFSRPVWYTEWKINHSNSHISCPILIELVNPNDNSRSPAGETGAYNIYVNLNTLRPRQNGRHLPDDIFKCISLNESVWISIEIPLKFVRKGSINNIPALVQIMAWCRPGAKPLSEPMMVRIATHICVTRPQWVKIDRRLRATGLVPSKAWHNMNKHGICDYESK